MEYMGLRASKILGWGTPHPFTLLAPPLSPPLVAPLRTPPAKPGGTGEGGSGIYCLSARHAVVLEADHRAGDRRRPCDDDVAGGAGDAGAPSRTQERDAGGMRASGGGAGPMGSLGLIWVRAAAGLPSFSGVA
jgi:hypothetical protein